MPNPRVDAPVPDHYGEFVGHYYGYKVFQISEKEMIHGLIIRNLSA